MPWIFRNVTPDGLNNHIMKKASAFILLSAAAWLPLIAGSCSRQEEGATGGKPHPAEERRLLAEAPRRGDYELRLYCRPADPAIHDTITLEFECVHPSGSQAAPAPFDKASLQSLDLVGQRGLSTILQPDGRYRSTWSIELEPQLLDEGGRYLIPAQEVAFADPATGDKTTMATAECVLSIPQPSEEELAALSINDQLPPVTRLQPFYRRLLVPGAVAAAAIAAALAGWRLWRRRRAKTPAIPPLSPYDQAILALDALLQQKLPENGEYQAYYTGISAILRQYLERRFALHAPKLTTEEFLHELASHADARLQPHRPLLQDFLTACDLVKFAGQIPTVAQDLRLAQSCRNFLDGTGRPEAPASPEK